MSEPRDLVPTDQSDLAAIARADAMIEPFKSGGVVERAIGAPQRDMDGIVVSHLDTVAKLRARGDTVPERPTYVLNPENGLLIIYSYRRDEDSNKEGLFADVVQLDESGEPGHGVDIADPSELGSVFINVAVGDNSHNLPPSYTKIKREQNEAGDEDVVPPNIETAELMAMLSQRAIDKTISLASFLAERSQVRDELRQAASIRRSEHYLPTEQSLDERINPDLHVIISDRDKRSRQALADISGNLGLYPLIVTLDHIEAWNQLLWERAKHPTAIRPGQATLADLLNHIYTDVGIDFRKNIPAFVTIDIPDDKNIGELGRHISIDVPHMTLDERDEEAGFTMINTARDQFFGELLKEMLQRTPVFSKIVSQYNLYRDEPVTKTAHGGYKFWIDPADSEIMDQYEAWLRKAKLDLAMTRYLRAVSEA